MMNEVDHAQLLKTAALAAKNAGEILQQKWQQPKTLSQKGFRDWVTDTDLAAQKLITDLIRERHPSHGFLAEESSSPLPSTGDVLWIIDPIDGTTNYSREQPNFCISIAALADDTIQAGIIFDPLRDELFSAMRGSQAHLNGGPMQVSTTRHLGNSVLAFDWAHSRHDRQATLDSLQGTAHEVRSLRSIGSAALAMAWVAAGRLDAYWNWQLNAWDLAAGVLLIERAGGRCTTLNGGRLLAGMAASSCLLSNGILHAELQQALGTTDGL